MKKQIRHVCSDCISFHNKSNQGIYHTACCAPYKSYSLCGLIESENTSLVRSFFYKDFDNENFEPCEACLLILLER